MKQFNLEDYLNSDKTLEVITRDGRKVEILKTDFNSGYNDDCVIGVVDYGDGTQSFPSWKASGSFRGAETNLDLFFTTKWYDNITKPVLCWVTDGSPEFEDKYLAILIESYDEEVGFMSTDETDWKYAKPVVAEDLVNVDGGE